MRWGRRGIGVPSLQTSLLACVLAASGCVRFGYHQADARGGAGGHSGAGSGGQPSTDGGMGGEASSGSSGGAGAGGSGNDASLDGAPPPLDDGATDGGDASVIGDAEAGLDDAAVTDGGDAASDGSVDNTHMCPENPDWLFCSGFEPNDLSRWGYKLGLCETQDVIKRSGDHALSARTQPPGDIEARWAAEDVLRGQTSGDIWMRSWYYLPSSVMIDTHFSLGIISDIEPPYNGFELRVLSTGVAINYSVGNVESLSPISSTQFPRDRWVCVELHVLIDASEGVYEAFLDLDPVARVTPVDTLPDNGFGVAEIGIHYAPPSQGPVQVYIDDVVVANSRVPCN